MAEPNITDKDRFLQGVNKSGGKTPTGTTTTPTTVGSKGVVRGDKMPKILDDTKGTTLPLEQTQPYRSGASYSAAPAATGSDKDKFLAGFGSGKSSTVSTGGLATVPATQEQMSKAVDMIIRRVINSEGVSPWATDAILKNLSAMRAVPEAAFVLSNPEVVGQWQDALWMGTIDAFATQYDGALDEVIDNYTPTSAHIAKFFKDTGSIFTTQERKALQTIVASMPSGQEIIKEKHISKGKSNGSWWHNSWMNFQAGWDVVTQAPEAIGAVVNEPREQLVSLMISYLSNNDVSSRAEKEKFFTWAASHAAQQIDSVKAKESGFFKFAAQTFDLSFVPTSDWAGDWLQSWANPEEFATRQYLSIGQNFAVGLGIDPSESHFSTVSAITDAFINIVGDPNNLAFGFASAMRNASLIPRTVSRGEALRAAINPFGGKTLGLPVMDRGFINRFSFAVLSRDAEKLVKTGRGQRAVGWIAATDSMSRIAERYPDLTEPTVRLLSQVTNPEEVSQILIAGLHGGAAVVDDAPLLIHRTQATLSGTEDAYLARRSQYLSSADVSLNDLSMAIDKIDPSDIYHVVLAGDEAAASSLKTTSQIAAAEGIPARIVGAEDTAAGIVKITVRSVGDTNLYEAVLDGNVVGAAMGENIGVFDAALREMGIGTAIRKNMSEADLAAAARSTSVSPQGAALSGLPATVTAEDLGQVQIYKRAVDGLTGTGNRAAAVSQVGAKNFLRIDLNDPEKIDDAIQWLLTQGDLGDEVATALTVGGSKFTDLSVDAQKLLQKYGDAAGADLLHLGDEMVTTRKGSKLVVEGRDGIPSAGLAEAAATEIKNLTEAQIAYKQMNAAINSDLFFVKQLPTVSTFKKVRQGLSTTSNKKFMQGLRRAGFRMTHNLPGNINLVNGAEGSRVLRNWVKALGGSDELAAKLGDEFLEGSPETRKDIILKALQEVGETIDNKLLANNLVTFGEKQGHYTYFFGRDGKELGLGLDGSIKPMTLSHFSDEFAMPDAKTLLRSNRRYNAATGRLPRINRGLRVTGTKTRRARNVQNLKAKFRRLGHDTSELTDDDWAAMAYADILTSETGYKRPAALGWVGRAASMAGSAYQMFHHVFVIAQLAGRPLAWASRFLMEETVRADMFALPSLWQNPKKYIGGIMDASAIRKMPARAAAQARVADGLVNEFFALGHVDWNRLEEVIPDIRRVLTNAEVDLDNFDKVHAYVSHLVGREMIGGGQTEASIGLRGNITRRALLNQRKLNRTLEKMDNYGLLDSFRWDIDGKDIANRSWHQSWMKEMEAGSIPIEYALEGMTAKGLETLGRSYGRQMYQMIHDPIVGTYSFSRAIATATGTTNVHTGERLVQSSLWPRIKHIVDSRLQADGIEMASEVAKADWYLDQIDEIPETLFRPLSTDPTDYARILSGLKNGGTVTIDIGEVSHILSPSASNYEGFVRTIGLLAQDAYDNGVMLPRKVSSWIDPRFGQEDGPNIFRRATDWSMMVFGEKSTQNLHRQPAYLHLHKQYYDHYRAMGWPEDSARIAATQKAAETVNYIFFDNKNIPQFLKDMNQVIPFFSAMYEVGQTWMWKIPSQSVLPVGFMQLGRRVSRTLNGLVASGLVDLDPETGQMTLNVDSEMLNARDPVSATIGKGLYQWLRAPVTLAEYIGGLGSLMDDDGYTPANLSAFAKDGFSLNIGNPLDFGSHGIMAVNQFSVGGSPLLQLPMSMAATAVFAQSDEKMDTEGTLADFIVEHPDIDVGELVRYNQAKFVEVNGKEMYNRALNGDLPLSELAMPDYVDIHQTSTWETLVDRAFFPFGKLEGFGQVLTSVSPAAMNYIWRGLFEKLGMDDDSTFLGMMFGQMSNYQVAAEIITQAQMLEATEGVLTKSLELSTQLSELVDKYAIEIAKDPEGASYVLDPNGPYATEAQALIDEIELLNFTTMKRASDNAAGSLLMRGVMGQLGPVTPRMWTREQLQARDYWDARELATEAKVTGSINYAKMLEGRDFNTIMDLERIGQLTQDWLADPSGDRAKVFLRTTNPGLQVFTQGKTYWGPAGPPPEARGFDQWVEDLEAGDRAPFPVEVFMARYQRAAVAVDKEIAIIEKYGNDPDKSAQAILSDYDAYKNVVDDFDMQYEALDFLDHYVYDSAYSIWKRDNLDELTAYSLVKDRVSKTQDEIDNIQDLLDYADLDPDERRQIRGVLASTISAQSDAIRDQAVYEDNETFMNPREQVLARYWDLSNSYYDGRNKIFEELDNADNKMSRSLVFDAVRMYNNEWYLQQHTIEGFNGEQIVVPPPQLRTWNGKSQAERQEKILNTVAKKPEWLDLFEIDTLVHEFGPAVNFLPSTMERQRIYDEAAIAKYEVTEFARRNPELMSDYERQKEIRAIEDQVDHYLLTNGRDSEYTFRNALPVQRLGMLHLLPDSLAPILPMVNQIRTELIDLGKSPTTNVGDAMFRQLRNWMQTDLFITNPQAAADFDRLGLVMYDEPLRDAVFARLLQGDFFNELTGEELSD